MEWFTDFGFDHISTNVADRPEGPNEVTTDKILNKIHDIVLDHNM